MKKLFQFLAIGAVVLGMASCDNENVKLKNFKVTVDYITVSQAHFTIEAAKEDTRFVYILVSKGFFVHERSTCDPLLQSGLEEEATGDIEGAFTGLYPGLEYVLLVHEIDAEGNLVGDLEYVIFKVEDVEVDKNTEIGIDHPLRHLIGTVTKTEDGRLKINGEAGSPGFSYALNLFVYAKGLTGKFGKDDLSLSIFDVPTLVYDEERYRIFNAEFTGVEKDGKYEYEGWMDVYGKLEGKQGAWRLPFNIVCEEKEEAKEL